MTDPQNTPTAHERRVIAVTASVHPVTVLRYLRGLPIRSTCRARIEAALAELQRQGAQPAGASDEPRHHAHDARHGATVSAATRRR